MSLKEFNIESYHLSHRTGCMLEEPQFELPSYFEPWNRLSKAIGDLVKEGLVREEVHKLPLLDASKLEGYRQLRLAHLQLSFITSGYVWQDGDKGAAKILPKSVAIPFCQVSKELGVHPILCHMDLVLSNQIIGNYYTGEYDDLSNIDCFYRLPGGEVAKPFVTVTILVEMEFAKCLKPIEKIVNILQEYTSEKDQTWHYYNMQDIVRHLENLADCIKNMKRAFSLMHDHLPAATFFNVLRPFLAGWGGEGNILPDGLIYEGVSEEPIQQSGGSAAQSTSMQALDAFLGITHSGERKEFLVAMRNSMPPDHVRFIDDLEKYSFLSSYVKEMDVPALTKAYNKCITASLEFRSFHIGIVTKYIISAAKNTNEGNYKSLDEKGTGGTDLLPFLKGLITNTQTKLIKANPSDQSKTAEVRGGLNINLLIGLAFSGLFVFALSKKMLT